MRKTIGKTWLYLSGALLVSLLPLVPGMLQYMPRTGLIASFCLVAGALKWPLVFVALAYLFAPRPSHPPKSALELSDRTQFSKVMLWAALALFVLKLVLALL
jgi:hypothetical protein